MPPRRKPSGLPLSRLPQAMIPSLQGICFLREAPERANGTDRRERKWGLRGKRGRERCFGAAVGGVSVRRIPNPRRQTADSGDFTAVSTRRERSSPSRFAKNSFGSGFSASLSGSSCVFENQDAAVFQMDFGCLPLFCDGCHAPSLHRRHQEIQCADFVACRESREKENLSRFAH